MECFECGQKASHRHHIIPKLRGGTKCVWLCISCHAKVHGTLYNNIDINTLTSEAMQAKKKNNELIGDIPIGKKLGKDGIHLINDRREIKIIKLVLNMHSGGLGCYKIATALNNKNIKARGKKWYYGTIERILKNSGINIIKSKYAIRANKNEVL